MRHATINLCKRGVSRVEDTVAFLKHHGIHVAALPEIQVNQSSAPGFLRQWKHHGFHAALSECGSDAHSCVGLVSTEPFKQIQLCVGPGKVRHVAGLFTACNTRVSTADRDIGMESLLIISFYGQSGNHIAAEAQIEDDISAAEESGFRWACVGDCNLVQHEGLLSNAAVNGAIHLLDDCAAGAPLPGTGPTGTRRIDFGIAQWSIRATQVNHLSSDLSDHTVVVYDLPWIAPNPFVGPRRLPECAASEDDIARLYLACDPEPFEEACEAGKYEEAWAWLSYHAEASLCEYWSSSFVHRAEHWEPLQFPRENRINRQGDPLSVLRKLMHRLEELHVRQDESLSRCIAKSLRGVRAHFPDLPFVPFAEVRTLLQWVRDKVQILANQQRDDALRRWRAKLRFDPKKQRTFVKDRVNRQLEYEKAHLEPTQAKTFGSTHPAVAVEEHAAKWMAKWSKVAEDRATAIDQVLSEVPRVARVQCDVNFSGSALRRAASVMATKAPGPDSWQASSLLKLPITWWDRLARLWQLVWETGSVPESWAKATVVLIRKQGGAKTRPITLTQAAWRIGARVIAQSLHRWTDQWADTWDQGGIGSRSVEGALYQLQAALRRGTRRVLLLDVAAYFDSISSQLVTKTLDHLGAPVRLAPLLTSFYQQALRVFSFDGMLSRKWSRTCLGIPQGCPLSPCVAAAVAHTWAAYIREGCPSVGITAFMDDRTCWLEPNASLTELQTAIDRSNAVDEAFGFALSPDKCVVAAFGDDEDARTFASRQGFKCQTCIELLGVRLQFTGCGTPLRFSLRKVLLRIRAIRWTQAPTPARAALIRSLVVPCYSWAAGIAVPDDKEISLVQNEVHFAFHDKLGGESLKLLIYELLGWFLEPRFQIDFVSLRRFWRWHAHFPEWADDLPIQHLASQWNVHLPGVIKAFEKLGWWTERGGDVVCRRDEAGGIRRIHVGLESFTVLKEWLQAHYRQTYVRRCARIWRSFHRNDGDSTVAVGLDLPCPMPAYRPALIGHKLMWQDARDEYTRKSAFVAGGHAWHFNHRGDFGDGHPRWQCECGGWKPSRPHVMWACESTRSLRQGINPPTHRGEERLLAMHLPEQPPPPPEVDLNGLREDIADAIFSALQSHHSVVLACDGSAKQDVATFAVVVHEEQYAFAGGDGLEDQSAYRAELQGLFFAVGATVDAARRGARGDVILICDCSSAITAVSSQHGDAALVLRNIADLIQEANNWGVRVQLEWVPSHGKRPDWQPTVAADPLYLRRLNEAADAAAKQSCERRLAGSLRARWAILRAKCAQWEYQAVQLASGAARQLHQHLIRFGTRRGETSPLG